ncbi:MAG: hypothetical protein IT298_11900 [Chloroflexi bacterium]|jgi:hypothetical protein|nr:MAG: hypothetical protein UZ13_00081 [Chloroflexi bacterium OLB13]MBC6954869.1 hypothetical protein [Chloroflexota bacterium]MBV6437155.1 hypothetical protein [Anaerolineae bacterium]MDL1915802.1 hypothetical protein [Anaerolineae bacterium CFX4]OQY81017.1 MAG: hypothetical protein B6D42_12020 [Anaerolineae bacterium UTCFX5]
MNANNHVLLESLNQANRRAGASVAESEITLGTWQDAPRQRESAAQLDFNPGIFSVVLALVVLVAVL